MRNSLFEWLNSRFQVKIILLENALDFFNFIDLQLRYRTSSISHPFNYEILVITVFSRGTEGSGKQVFRVRACISVVCVRACACARVCERAVHADLKFKAGLKLNIMMEHTRMPARHSFTPHTYARTHSSHTRIVLTPHMQTKYACHAHTPHVHVYHVRHAHKIRLACMT